MSYLHLCTLYVCIKEKTYNACVNKSVKILSYWPFTGSRYFKTKLVRPVSFFGPFASHRTFVNVLLHSALSLNVKVSKLPLLQKKPERVFCENASEQIGRNFLQLMPNDG